MFYFWAKLKLIKNLWAKVEPAGQSVPDLALCIFRGMRAGSKIHLSRKNYPAFLSDTKSPDLLTLKILKSFSYFSGTFSAGLQSKIFA